MYLKSERSVLESMYLCKFTENTGQDMQGLLDKATRLSSSSSKLAQTEQFIQKICIFSKTLPFIFLGTRHQHRKSSVKSLYLSTSDCNMSL